MFTRQIMIVDRRFSTGVPIALNGRASVLPANLWIDADEPTRSLLTNSGITFVARGSVGPDTATQPEADDDSADVTPAWIVEGTVAQVHERSANVTSIETLQAALEIEQGGRARIGAIAALNGAISALTKENDQ